MKQFKFSLDTVLNYKNQVLEDLKREHGLIVAEVVQKEAEIAILEQEYHRCNDEFNESKEQGMSILDAMNHKAHLHIIQHNIKEENKKLEILKHREMEKRKEVVAAKTETSSIDKLKEKRIEEYRKLEQKAEELFIEEFVVNSRHS